MSNPPQKKKPKKNKCHKHHQPAIIPTTTAPTPFSSTGDLTACGAWVATTARPPTHRSYVTKYGGKIVKSVTRAVTHLVNDHGEVGPSKLAKCKKNGVPIVGEDVILELVRQSAPQPAPATLMSRGSGGEGGDLPKPKQLKETENFIF